MTLGGQSLFGKDSNRRTHFIGHYSSGKRNKKNEKEKPRASFKTCHRPYWGLWKGKRMKSARLPKGKFQKPFFICSYSCGKNHPRFSLLINMSLQKHLFQ